MDKDAVRSVPDGLSRSASSQQAVSPVPASIPSADALVHLMVDWAEIPKYYFDKRYPFFGGLLDQVIADYAIGPANETHAAAWAFVEIAQALLAQAIEARRAETQSGSVHESAVGNADAPNTQVSETPSDTLGEKA